MNSQVVCLYVLKAILVAGIFLGYYWLALRNKKLHHYNRFYLLVSLALSVVIPFLNFSWVSVDPSISYYGATNVLDSLVAPVKASSSPAWNWIDLTMVSYIAIAVGFLVTVIINISKLYQIKRKSIVTRMEDIDFIDTEEDDAPFSYLKNLFWKRSISLESEDGKKIFKHELTHIQQKHTWDRLFCQLLCAVLWINPFYWIIRKELFAIHEFIADEEAVGDADTESFARMLLQTHYGDHFLLQTQSFFYSSIKRRLIMLTTSKHTPYSYLRRVIVLPLLVLTIGVFSFQVKAKTGQENAKLSLTNPGNISATSQEPAKFPGGQAGWQQFLSTTLNRDRLVQKGAGPGKYVVQLSFIVDRDGDVRDVKALTDPGYGTKEDAMRVLLSSPKWIPAMLNGKKVVYRNKIAITYMVSEE